MAWHRSLVVTARAPVDLVVASVADAAAAVAFEGGDQVDPFHFLVDHSVTLCPLDGAIKVG